MVSRQRVKSFQPSTSISMALSIAKKYREREREREREKLGPQTHFLYLFAFILFFLPTINAGNFP
jgi:hypothetical protein